MKKMNPLSIKKNMAVLVLCLFPILFINAMESDDNNVTPTNCINREMLDLLQQESTWKTMGTEVSSAILSQALRYASWEGITKDCARETLSNHVDRADVPHGDLAISSKKVHSNRYIISQWQRSAAGAIVVVLGRDDDGDLCVALGPQRGKMVLAQGYMEVPLPNEDLTGLKKQGASRINNNTGELVKADTCIEDTAVREVREELGLNIAVRDLTLLDIASGKEENPIVPTVAPIYGVLLNDTPPLKTLDDEFITDDMQDPQWYKIRNIKCIDGQYYVPGKDFPIRRMPVIQKAIDKLVPNSGNMTK